MDSQEGTERPVEVSSWSERGWNAAGCGEK